MREYNFKEILSECRKILRRNRGCAMCGPPDLESERAALAGSPNRKADLKKPEENTETTADIQVRSLRQRLAVGYSLAASLAPLIWGMPR